MRAVLLKEIEDHLEKYGYRLAEQKILTHGWGDEST
jgi:hypothetical protein